MVITIVEFCVRQPVERRQRRTPARIFQVIARTVVRSVLVARVTRDYRGTFFEIISICRGHAKHSGFRMRFMTTVGPRLNRG